MQVAREILKIIVIIIISSSRSSSIHPDEAWVWKMKLENKLYHLWFCVNFLFNEFNK